MVSELFFCFAVEIVSTDFERNPLTHTLTHITIVYSGHSGISGFLVLPKQKNFENLNDTKNISETTGYRIRYSILSSGVYGSIGTRREALCLFCFVSYRDKVRIIIASQHNLKASKYVVFHVLCLA
jgi:hypothetical protein